MKPDPFVGERRCDLKKCNCFWDAVEFDAPLPLTGVDQVKTCKDVRRAAAVIDNGASGGIVIADAINPFIVHISVAKAIPEDWASAPGTMINQVHRNSVEAILMNR